MAKIELFHPGELHFQRAIGVEAKVANLAPLLIFDHLPNHHRIFYSYLNMIFVASVDKCGQPWASVLSGEPGFIQTIDERLVSISANPMSGDPLSENLKVNSHLGLLGLDFQSRRRNRMEGQINYRYNNEFVININKAFGNCPKYIQSRKIKNVSSKKKIEHRTEIQRIDFFDDKIKQLISTADTFFIASYFPQRKHRGADVSHRGGKPGFVKIENDNTLIIEDYSGNNLFMTLGNLYSNPVAGLLFINFQTGDILQLACTSNIIDTPENIFARKIQFTLNYGWFISSALSIECDFIDYSPFLN